MPNYIMKSVVYHGVLPCAQPAAIAAPSPVAEALQPISTPISATMQITAAESSPSPAPGETFYSVISQSREELQSPGSSPSLSVWPHLLASAQTQRLNSISIYAEQGLTAEAMRFLYLNDTALEIWTEMRGPVKVLSRMRRPPRGATLSFGMPFAD